MKNYKWMHVENTPPKLTFYVDPPVGYIKFMNITIALWGKMPNKFQRWMLKKCFGFEITEETEYERQ